MPSKTKARNAAIAAKTAALPTIPKELIEQFVKGPMTAEAVHAASAAFKKALIERALGAELGHHLGYPAGASSDRASTTIHWRPLSEVVSSRRWNMLSSTAAQVMNQPRMIQPR